MLLVMLLFGVLALILSLMVLFAPELVQQRKIEKTMNKIVSIDEKLPLSAKAIGVILLIIAVALISLSLSYMLFK